MTFVELWPRGRSQRSRSHKGYYSTQHTTLWSCTHIPNIVDLSQNTKMLWPGQEKNTILKTLLLLSEACPDHNFFFFPDRSIIFGMWMHDHKAVVPVPKWPSWNFDLEVKYVRFQFAKWLQRRRLKSKTLQTTDAKWEQYVIWPLYSWSELLHT
jgi:hypothetical protein